MRIVLLSLAVLSVLISSTGFALAQTTDTSNPVLGIYAQVIVRDQAGNLVSYLETSRVTIVNTLTFNQQINENIGLFQRSVVEFNGQQIEILKANETLVHTFPTIVSGNLISVKTANGDKTLVFAEHDGYPMTKGDRVTTYWTIVRALS